VTKDAVGCLRGIAVRRDEDGEQVPACLGHHSGGVDDRREIAVGQGCVDEDRIPADDEGVGARSAEEPVAGSGEAHLAVDANRLVHVGDDAARFSIRSASVMFADVRCRRTFSRAGWVAPTLLLFQSMISGTGPLLRSGFVVGLNSQVRLATRAFSSPSMSWARVSVEPWLITRTRFPERLWSDLRPNTGRFHRF
jgi:hypothetical protein